MKYPRNITATMVCAETDGAWPNFRALPLVDGLSLVYGLVSTGTATVARNMAVGVGLSTSAVVAPSASLSLGVSASTAEP